MDARTPAETAHRIAHLRLDERVDDDRRPAAGASDRELEILDGFDAGVADLLELLIRELGLEGLNQPRRGFAGGVGDDVQLDGWVICHRAIVADRFSGSAASS